MGERARGSAPVIASITQNANRSAFDAPFINPCSPLNRLHVMLRVTDLDEATRFYAALFAAEPTVRKADYAKWMLDDSCVNFSVAEKDADHGIEHLGIQAETPAELDELRERIDRSGGTVTNEGETTCCYATSDKTWVVDRQGVPWEAFYTSGDADTYRGEDETACCMT